MQNSNCMQEILLKIDILKEDYQKSFKKLILSFFSNPVPFNRQTCQKQKGLGTKDQSLFRLQNKFTKMSSLVIYYLTMFDGIIYSSFWVIPKITPVNLCKPVDDIINFHLSFWVLKVWKGRGKMAKIWISWERKGLFRWHKKYLS